MHSVHYELKIVVVFGRLYLHPIEYSIIILFCWIPCLYILTIPQFCSFVNINIYIHIDIVCFLIVVTSSLNTLYHSGYYGDHIKHNFHVKIDYNPYGVIDIILKTGSK